MIFKIKPIVDMTGAVAIVGTPFSAFVAESVAVLGPFITKTSKSSLKKIFPSQFQKDSLIKSIP